MSSTVQVVCPQCQTTNRLPRQRLGDSAVCGRCKAPLFSGKAVALDAASFERQLQNSDLPLIVDFWADWCGPCKSMAPQFQQAAARLEPNARLAKVDTEAEQGLAARYAIRSIPTLIAFHEGREVARTSGALSAEAIVRWVNSAVG